ncbi:MAG: hypothetical protein KDA68_17770, partial [Planctomycetaceae bacterium]|nr:hypothetical protein [Planctomycetaceae bacterium]
MLLIQMFRRFWGSGIVVALIVALLGFPLSMGAEGAELTATARKLIDRREELLREIQLDRQSGNAVHEWEGISELCSVERNLLAELEEDPNCPRAQVDFLRDQHMGVLKAIADRDEQADL